jgi:ABC-type transport system involved in cytochrome bd biosynthesis fused ATPase/permease subunit
LAAFDLRLVLVILIFLGLVGLGVPWLVWILGRGIGQKLVKTQAELNVALIDGIQGMADLLSANRGRAQQAQVQKLSGVLIHLQERMA